MTSERSPFKIGDTVTYRPTDKGRGAIIMSGLRVLEPGKRYKVVRIDADSYVVVEGFEHAAGGGLYWTEFAAQ
jgi:hypothetical protein